MIARCCIALIIIVFAFFLPQSYCFAQDKSKVQFAKVTPGDFNLGANPLIDTNTNAVILASSGSVHFIGNRKSWFSYVFKKQVRAKLLTKKSFDLATVKIMLYGEDENIEKLSDVTGTTYNLENGQVVETKLSKQDIFSDRLNKKHLEQKFTLPAVKEGSIIEYSYTITSDYSFNLPSWNFQMEEYPCMMSEYMVDIPQTLNYIFVRQGIHGFAIDKGSEGNESFKVVRPRDQTALAGQDDEMIVSARTIKHQWVMKDVPALYPEKFLTTPANYIDRIEFQLSKTYDGQDFHEQMNNWKKATEELLHREDFGMPLTDDNDLLTDFADKAAGNTSGLEQTKSIYYYVSSHFSCTNHYDPFIKTNFRDVLRKNSGTVGDINLLLTALLRKKGWQADPVLLSTRDFGYNLASYPVFQKLNYVIVRLKVDGKIYYLDAAHPQLAFGHLAGDCYNGHARIISERDSASIYFEPDSLKESKTTLVLVNPSEKGQLEGMAQTTFGQQQSYNMRLYASEHGKENYFKELQAGFGDDVSILNGDMDSLNLLEEPVKIHYDFRMSQEPGASILYINPMWWSENRNNPFTATTRKYPVEMPYVLDDTYIFNMEIPKGYVVDELPKSAKVALNGDQGMFEYIIGQTEDHIQMRWRLRLNKAWFPAEDYTSLRDFFGYIVKKESENIVLKKK